MAVYQLELIAQDVRVALDRNASSATLREIKDLDTLTVDEIIKSKVVEAVKRVHSIAPVHLLDGGYHFGKDEYKDVDIAVYWNDDDSCSGYVVLPDDFMRFVVFKMSDWARAVFACLTTDDVEYEKQSSPFKGVRGTAQNPKCFISVRAGGSRILEFYSCKSEDAWVVQAGYLPYPKVDNNQGIVICSKCYDAVVYTVAALVVTTFGDIEKSNIFNELAKSTLI